tara:strand:- start:38 stop:529 length:492 start_codon:yes stop_codon:yes gene_type:complete
MSTLSVDTIQGKTTAGTVAMPSGSVVQVINAENSTSTATSSTSFVSTNVTATITPKFVSSKILVICQTQLRQNTGTVTGSHIAAQIHRGSTAIGQFIDHGTREIAGPNNTDNVATGAILKVLDSPSTTSATTYTVHIKSFNSDCSASVNSNGGSSMTLMEISQ